MAFKASPPLFTCASTVSWSMPSNSSDHFWKTWRARCLTLKSSSPQIRRTGAGEAGAGGMLFLLLLATVFVDPLEDFTHVLNLLEKRRGDVEGLLLRGGEGEAI